VTGASGRTGALVVSQLLKLGDVFEVRAVVRSAQVGGSDRPGSWQASDRYNSIRIGAETQGLASQL